MKKLLLLLFIGFASTVNAQKFVSQYDQLVSVNQQWKNQPDVNPSLKSTLAQPLAEQQLVQFHLLQTEVLLRSRNVSKLSPTLQKQRETNLNTLHGYLTNGVFPINDMHQNRQPYFIDKFNTYCAVGYLMKMSGADKMAKEIHDTQNFSYLFDIKHPQLMEWASSSGLTLGELALIQPAYGDLWRASLTEIHYNNIGADVNEYIEFHQFHGDLGHGGVADSLIFYDEAGVVYKRLAVTSMQTFVKAGHPFKYYSFPANENFADKGKVEIKGTIYTVSNILLQTITYSDVSVVITDYNSPSPGSSVYSFSIGENESTPIGSSLNYCEGSIVASSGTTGSDASCLRITPIALSKFDYTITNKKVNLTWETVSEINNSHFIVERSTDGVIFEEIGRVNGAGTSNSVKLYSFADNRPAYINQYRLKQVDFDGKATYSKILYAKVQQANPLTITVNPVKANLQVQISWEVAKAGSLTIYDFTGRKVKSIVATNGYQLLDIATLASGKYLLQLVTADGQVFNQQFIKTD